VDSKHRTFSAQRKAFRATAMPELSNLKRDFDDRVGESPLDAIKQVHLEWFANVIACQVLNRALNGEIISASLPRFTRC
jgi:hypothetical protein